MENIRLDTPLEVIKKEIKTHYLSKTPQEALPGEKSLGALANTKFQDWVPFLQPLVSTFYSLDHITLWDQKDKVARSFDLVAAGIRHNTIKLPEQAQGLIDLIHVFVEEIEIREASMNAQEKAGDLKKLDEEIEGALGTKHGTEEEQEAHNKQFMEERDEIIKDHDEEMIEDKDKPLDE